MLQFDEQTQYVVEENGELVVKQLELVDEPIVESAPADFVSYIPEPTFDEQLRADVDYIAIMTGVEL